MTCDHGYIGACAECDGSGQIPPPETVHPIGCECEACSAAYERDRRDPRDGGRPWSSNPALIDPNTPSQRRRD